MVPNQPRTAEIPAMSIVAVPQHTDQTVLPQEDHTASDCPAHRLTPAQRRQLALDALAGAPISQLAAQHQVSRKFVYQQLDIAHDALEQAFSPPPQQPEKVLFYLPVTRCWIRQFVLALVLICHCPLRGVVEMLADLFGYSMSLGTAHNIVQGAVAAARQVNATEDLSGIRIGGHDEIFQAGDPVLVGVDTRSTYCYLLSLEEHRDSDTWGVRLLELAQRGFHPDATIADFAKALRCAQEQALPGVVCRGDIFHCLYEVQPLVRYLETRAYDVLETVEKLTTKQQQHERRKGRKDLKVAQQLWRAKEATAKAVALADDVATLYDWLRRDILAVAGPDYQSRRELLDFVVDQLQQRETQCAHRISPVRKLLQNHADSLLAFAKALDEDSAELALAWQVSAATVVELLKIQQMSEKDSRRWQREAAYRLQLGTRYYGLSEAVAQLAASVVRASSLVENVNSRLRSYFFLRRQLGPDYLELLRFFLNHRRLVRSACEQRVGKSPAELLSGQEHKHWLEMLGFQRFRRAA
jgi:hypothetical protein